MAAALAKDPAQRFQSAIAFGDAFRSTLGMPPDTGWMAGRVAAQAARYAQQIAAGQAHRAVAGARNAVAAALRRLTVSPLRTETRCRTRGRPRRRSPCGGT